MVTALTVTLAKTSAIFLLICLIALLTSPVWAKDSTPTGTTTGTPKKDRVEKRVETKRQEVKDSIGLTREKLQERKENLRERIATKTALLKERLEKFRDQKKAQVVERVSDNLNRINAKRSEMLLKHLDKMTELLNKLENRVSSGSPDIKDPTLAKEAIADARVKIASAREAVMAQVDKDYTLTVSTETRVKTDAKSARDSLHGDLKSVRELVVEAKQAVAEAIRIAHSLIPQPTKEGTASGQQ